MKRTLSVGGVPADFGIDLLVREAPGSDTVIGRFPLTLRKGCTEAAALNVWEHVRGFMEARGPWLPPGDEPGKPAPDGFLEAFFHSALCLLILPCLVGVVWTWDVVYWEAMFWVDRNYWLASEAIRSDVGLVSGVVAFVSWLVVVWELVVILGGYLAENVLLPEGLLDGAGELVDFSRLARDPVYAAGLNRAVEPRPSTIRKKHRRRRNV